MWPVDGAAFGAYWEDGLQHVSIDPAVRAYLYDVIALRFLPAPVHVPHARLNVWLTTGFLAPQFRTAMRLRWSDEDERRFRLFVRAFAVARRPVPPALRRFPLDWFLWDFRIRSKLGLRLV